MIKQAVRNYVVFKMAELLIFLLNKFYVFNRYHTHDSCGSDFLKH